MGELTMNAGVFNFAKESEDNTIALNFRYPQGVDTDAIKAGLEKLEGPKAVSLSEHGHVPHYVPVDDPMVETLLSVYEKQTGLKGHEQIIGGGTFGRLLKRGVAYGAMFLVMSTLCTKPMSLLRLKTCTVQLPFMQKLSMS